ncbi:MAG: endonuclease III, partial [Candidatus Aenigmarchaeota archaeon]|nr:endonuclease III [Candidatus Aenigmarchaeota archaeon]
MPDAQKQLALLNKEYPRAEYYLNFTSPLELLVAVILSAQCTDEA